MLTCQIDEKVHFLALFISGKKLFQKKPPLHLYEQCDKLSTKSFLEGRLILVKHQLAATKMLNLATKDFPNKVAFSMDTIYILYGIMVVIQ